MNLKLNTMKALFLSTIFIASFILFQSCSDNQTPTGLQNGSVTQKNDVVHRGATSSNDEKPNTCIPCMDNLTIHVDDGGTAVVGATVTVTWTSNPGDPLVGTTNANGDAIFNWYNKGYYSDYYTASSTGGTPRNNGGYVQFYWDGQSILTEDIYVN